MSRSLCLKWNANEFFKNTMEKFKRYLLNEAFVDVTLACEGLTLKAHRMVLSACSNFFQSVFIENSSQHPIVVLKDVKYTDLKLIIDFMYDGEINVNEDQIESLIESAKSLQVDVLGDAVVDPDASRIFVDVPDEPVSDTPSNIPSMPATEQSTTDFTGNLWMGSLLNESEIKRSDSDIEDVNEDMNTDVCPSFTSTVPLETHEQGAGVNFAPFSIKESPSKFMTQTPITADDLQSYTQSNSELPNSFLAASTAVAVDKDLQNPSATSTVPLQTHNTNSFHGSQLGQPIEQGSDENFEPEPEPDIESKESSVSNLMEHSLTAHDAHSTQCQPTVNPSAELPITRSDHSSSYQSNVKSSIELPCTDADHSSQYESAVIPSAELPNNHSDHSSHYKSTVKSSVELPRTGSDHSSHYKSTVKSSVELPRTGSDHSSQHRSTKKSSVGVFRASSSHSSQHQSTDKPSVAVSRTSSSHSSQHQSTAKTSITLPRITSDSSSCYRVTLSSSDVLTVQTQQRGTSLGPCLKKIIVPKNMEIRSLEPSSSTKKQDLKKKKVRFNEVVQKDASSSNEVKKTASVSNEEKKSEESESRKVLVRIGTNGTITRTEKFFRCKKCSFKSACSLSLKRHVGTQHEQIPKFKCDKCDFEASLKENLARHTAEVHEKAKRFGCTLCSYKCDLQCHLKKHLESVHDIKKPFKCEICDFSTAKKTTLKKHVAAVHEHRKDFACDFCPYRSAAKGNVKRHMTLMHERKKSGKVTRKDDSSSDDQDYD